QSSDVSARANTSRGHWKVWPVSPHLKATPSAPRASGAPPRPCARASARRSGRSTAPTTSGALPRRAPGWRRRTSTRLGGGAGAGVGAGGGGGASGRGHLWEVAIDVATVKESNECHHIILQDQPEAVIADPNAVVGAIARQTLHACEIVQSRSMLYLFDHNLE